jgi:4-hydroxybenzoate polyprenyltransferase
LASGHGEGAALVTVFSILMRDGCLTAKDLIDRQSDKTAGIKRTAEVFRQNVLLARTEDFE